MLQKSLDSVELQYPSSAKATPPFVIAFASIIVLFIYIMFNSSLLGKYQSPYVLFPSVICNSLDNQAAQRFPSSPIATCAEIIITVLVSPAKHHYHKLVYSHQILNTNVYWSSLEHTKPCCPISSIQNTIPP